jgi:hypothetical protein
MSKKEFAFYCQVISCGCIWFSVLESRGTSWWLVLPVAYTVLILAARWFESNKERGGA